MNVGMVLVVTVATNFLARRSCRMRSEMVNTSAFVRIVRCLLLQMVVAMWGAEFRVIFVVTREILLVAILLFA